MTSAMPTLVRGATLRVGVLAVEDGSNVLHEPSHDWVIDMKTGTDVSFHSALYSSMDAHGLASGRRHVFVF